MNIDISPNLEKDFKKFVQEKHGKLRGKLGEEMEKALSFYLTHQEKTDTQDATTNAQLEKQLESDMQVISSANQTNNDIQNTGVDVEKANGVAAKIVVDVERAQADAKRAGIEAERARGDAKKGTDRRKKSTGRCRKSVGTTKYRNMRSFRDPLTYSLR